MVLYAVWQAFVVSTHDLSTLSGFESLLSRSLNALEVNQCRSCGFVYLASWERGQEGFGQLKSLSTIMVYSIRLMMHCAKLRCEGSFVNGLQRPSWGRCVFNCFLLGLVIQFGVSHVPSRDTLQDVHG
jgi:hypothetical protein